MVSFEDFLKLDMRVGKILDVLYHPQADKLYVLKVDIGERCIQLVAGLRPFYSQQELKDKLIIVVTNLEPKTIRGEKSEGMLLAVSADKGVYLIVPEKDVDPGSKIS